MTRLARSARILLALLAPMVACSPAIAQETSAGESTDEVRSPRIALLLEEIKRDPAGAVEAFRASLERSGAPLVEPIAEDSTRVLVTFVWFAEQDHQNVVVQSWLESRSLERRRMRQVGDTGLWYRSFAAPAGLTMGYLLSPDDARLAPDVGGETTDSWVPDPLNPVRARGALDLDWSVINLSGRELDGWMASAAPDVPDDRLVELRVDSQALGAEILVKVQIPAGRTTEEATPLPLFIFFDGFGFFDIDQVHRLMEGLMRRGEVPPTVVSFVYNPDQTRNRDMSCYEPTHRFLRDELLPLFRERFGAGLTPQTTYIAGRSRSGLGAVCAAYAMPDIFGNALSQSGAFWWAPPGEEWEWLARVMSTAPARDVVLYLDAGRLEDDPNPETGLSMLTVSRHLRDVARARGYQVYYREFPGGHDPIGWRTTLQEALVLLLAR